MTGGSNLTTARVWRLPLGESLVGVLEHFLVQTEQQARTYELVRTGGATRLPRNDAMTCRLQLSRTDKRYVLVNCLAGRVPRYGQLKQEARDSAIL